MKVAYNAESAIKQKISLRDKFGSLLYLNNLLSSGFKELYSHTLSLSTYIMTLYTFKSLVVFFLLLPENFPICPLLVLTCLLWLNIQF